MQTDPRHADLQAAIAALDLAQKKWDATAPGFHSAFQSGLSAVAELAAAAGADDVATRARRWFQDGGLSQRVFDDLAERVSDVIAGVALDLRDALYAERGKSMTFGRPTTTRVKGAWELLPQVKQDGTVVMPAPFTYPPGLDEAEVLEAIRPLIDNLDGLVVVLDFDGTSAPLQPGEGPTDTRADPTVNAVITALGMRARRVVMLTGRHPSELLGPDRLHRTNGFIIIGNDGLTRWTYGDGIKTPWLSAKDRKGIESARRLIQPFRDEGLRIEDKEYSFEVLVPVATTENLVEADAILDAIEPRIQALAKSTGLISKRNSTYWALRPKGPDKGEALRSLREEFDASALLFGADSSNDRAGLEVIEEWRGEGYPAVSVLSPSLHTTDDLYPLATLVVPGPAGVMAVGRTIAAAPKPAHVR